MIIQCNNCHKKFDLDANLIPEEGRLLLCSACNNTWFFKKEKIEAPQVVTKPEIQNDKEKESISPKVDHANYSEKSSNEEIENVKEEKIIEPLPDKKNKKNYRILNILVVSIISFAAFIIIVDTFKTPLGKVVPNTELLLYNLYETFRDIGLFIQDLF